MLLLVFLLSGSSVVCFGAILNFSWAIGCYVNVSAGRNKCLEFLSLTSLEGVMVSEMYLQRMAVPELGNHEEVKRKGLRSD